jgi:hypothetical protein
MYQRQDNARAGRGGPDGLTSISPDARARHAVARVRQALTDAPAGFALDGAQLRTALAVELADPLQQGERCFALGWLHWLAGEPAPAEPLLRQATELLPSGSAEMVQAAYWLARVQIFTHRPDPVADFERLLRGLSGSPQATCWFVDLLWRSGRADRAEQVWKAVRVNRRVAACEEAFLLETRSLLRQGDVAGAERTLREARPRGGVLQVERLLVLAWVMATRRQGAEALALLGQAQAGFYPRPALQAWEALLRQRLEGTPAALPAGALLSPVASAWIRGQQSRDEPAGGAASFQVAQTSAVLRPYARYGLACLGQEDFAAVLADLPGNFLAPRCRVWLTLARFCRREASAAELLSALQQAAAAGHAAAGLSAWQSFAQTLAESAPEPGQLWPADAAVEEPLATSRRRAAVEQALHQLTPATALRLLTPWGRSPELRRDEQLRHFVGWQLLRLVLMQQDSDSTAEVVQEVAELLDAPALPALVESLLATGAREQRSGGREDNLASLPPALRLWQAALGLAGRPDEEVSALGGSGAAGALARSLLVVQAARRGDAATVGALLEPASTWSVLPAGPPAFVVRALRSIRSAGRWLQQLARWLQAWKPETLTGEARTLAVQVGLLAPQPETAEPPAGTDSTAWFLHQAAQALGREDAASALTWARRTLAQDPSSLSTEQRQLAQEALPQLERLAEAQRLAQVVRLDPTQPAAPADLFAGLRDLLVAIPEGQQILTAAATGDFSAARGSLAALAERPDLPPRLLHHLALVYYRAARVFEEQERAEAEEYWRLSWRCWLAWAAQPPTDAELRDLLFGHLLGLHRDRLRDLLARGEVDRARRCWERVGQLPQLAPPDAAALAESLRQRLEQFREDLATEFLLDTREAMRHGSAPEGWRADYEQGLARLRRLLSLDRHNRRLLTALVELCADWFLDLYDAGDAARLRTEVERFTPLALQLVRGCASDLAARAALSEFFKFRGFIADDPERKRALYGEALELNPANDNVRKLLADLEDKS